MAVEIGCAVGTYRNGPAVGRLGSLAKLGIRWIEPQFGVDALDAEDREFMDAARRELETAGVRVWSVHSPWEGEYDISSPDEAVRERGITGIVRSARGCKALGGDVLVVHCGYHYPENQRDVRRGALDRSLVSLRRIVPQCAALGVRVALENLPPGSLTSSAEELLPIVEAFPRGEVGVCIDTGHAHVAGDAPGTVRKLADRIITTHLHDNDGSGDQHLVPGVGTIDWGAVTHELKRSPYCADGAGNPIMFEASGPGSHAEAIARLPEAARMIDAAFGSGA